MRYSPECVEWHPQDARAASRFRRDIEDAEMRYDLLLLVWLPNAGHEPLPKAGA